MEVPLDQFEQRMSFWINKAAAEYMMYGQVFREPYEDVYRGYDLSMYISMDEETNYGEKYDGASRIITLS